MVRPVCVVVIDEDSQHSLEVLAVQNHESVETFRANCANEALVWGAKTRFRLQISLIRMVGQSFGTPHPHESVAGSLRGDVKTDLAVVR